MNWLSLVKLFAGPIGGLINTGIATGAGALITWSVSKGVPLDAAQNVVGGLVLAASAAINAATGTQLVHVQSVRDNPTNGVTVVPVAEARRANIRPVDGPEWHSGA